MAQANNVPVRDVLTVQITRDRLVDNAAFAELRNLVRAGLDLYAMETARAKFAEAEKRRTISTVHHQLRYAKPARR